VGRVIDLAALKSALADVAGIDTLSLTNIGGRMVFGFNGLTAAVDPNSTDDHIIAAIRSAVAMRSSGTVAQVGNTTTIATPMPAPAAPAQPQPKATTMSNPAPGSFAASLKAIVDEAVAGVEQAKTDGLSKIREKVGKLAEAKAAVARVTDNMAQNIEDQANSVMSELGQISNDLG
jgi:chemotaxis protein histidine kinase CheA